MLALEAPAKVNLGLGVLARRGDGFHEIDTLIVRLDLADRVELVPGPAGVRLEVTGADLPSGAENLAARAAELYLRGSGSGVSIRLDKRIPVAAGLGGGSSDAAAVLRGLATVIPSGTDLLALAAQLGSDVPFFVQGWAAARAGGRGERLETVPPPRLHLVLANPAIPVSAREAYAALQNFSGRLDVPAILQNLAAGQEPGYLNALQAGVLTLYPAIRDVISALRSEGLRGVLLSGSGSTCFGVAPDAAAAAAAAGKLAAARPGWWVQVARTG